MQSTAIHMKLDMFRNGDACLLVPAGMQVFDDIMVTVWHGDELVLQKRLKVQRFNSGKAFISLPCTEDIIWQHREKVIIGVIAEDSVEVIRAAKNFEPVRIGPEDIL